MKKKEKLSISINGLFDHSFKSYHYHHYNFALTSWIINVTPHTFSSKKKKSPTIIDPSLTFSFNIIFSSFLLLDYNQHTHTRTILKRIIANWNHERKSNLLLINIYCMKKNDKLTVHFFFLFDHFIIVCLVFFYYY